jgi:mono/diheme cytochrome c family protein/plastocyanin
VILVFLSVLATGAYTLWDPQRAEDAEDVQLEHTLERGAYLFAQNCRVCHGDVGEGGTVSNRLAAAPPLNRPDLQGRDADGNVDDTLRDQAFDLVFNTISCGRVGTAMPPWSLEHGGTLNDEQIRHLTTLITQGEEHAWEFAAEEALHQDDINSLTLVDAIGEGDTTFRISSVEALSAGLRLQIDDELMLVEDVFKDGGRVTVERGLGRTSPAAHEAGAMVLTPPVPPDPPAVTGQDAPVCGQFARAVPTAGPQEASTDLEITAQGIQWDTATLVAVAGQPLHITINNNDGGIPHNWVLFDGEDDTAPRIAETPIEPGVIVQELDFGPLDPGEYFYWCDVHPNMIGILTAQ